MADRVMAAAGLACLYLLFCGWTAFRHARRGRQIHRMAATIDGSDRILIAYASQTGFAEQLAIRTARSLTDAGVPALLTRLGDLTNEALAQAQRALFLVSTTGEGDAPDDAARFLRKVMKHGAQLSHLNYGMLALGDRSYREYCAFGHRLDHWLRLNHATPLFDTVEVDNGEDSALRHWQANLRAVGAGDDMPDWVPARYERWRLAERRLLNPGSMGGPVFLVSLVPEDGRLQWQAGDIAEIGPRDPRDPDAKQPHREYSIASLPDDGHIELVVRQMRTPDGRLGLGSGWLTELAGIGDTIDLRIRSNRSFHPPEDDRPMILIGNGTGIAGLRAHLKAREKRGFSRNWLIFGERSSAHDHFFRQEIDSGHHTGLIKRLDLAFSRDQQKRVYVQHKLIERADDVRSWASHGAAIYVCGSLQGMAAEVHAALEEILGEDTLNAMVEDGRYRRDVY